MPPFGPPTNPTIFCVESTLSYWQNQALVAGTNVVANGSPSFGFSRMTLQWTRTTPATTREDLMVSHLDFAHTDIGIASPLSTAEMTELETAWGTAYQGTANRVPVGYTNTAIVWHNYSPINTRPGPADRTTLVNYPGTQAASRNADQLSINATYKTPSRKHWGRSYLPVASTTAVDTQFGRINNTYCDSIAALINAMFSTPGAGNGITPIVASIAYQGIMTVETIQVDNVFDVIRSRRAKYSSYRKTYDGS